MKNSTNEPDVTNRCGTLSCKGISGALFALLFALGGAAVLSGCDNDGPAEEVGEKIDEAADKAGDAIEDAADEIEDEIDDG